MSTTDNETATQNQQTTAQGDQPPIRTSRMRRIGQYFLENFLGMITAGATVALAIFAILAWKEAVRGTKIADQQLLANAAAFIFMEKSDFIADTSGSSVIWRFIPRWRNSGDTASADLSIHVNKQNGPFPAGYYLTDFTVDSIPIVLGPKATIETSFLTLPPSDFVVGLHIWGFAKYRDTIANYRHISRFCHVLVGWQGNPATPFGESAAPFLLPQQLIAAKPQPKSNQTGVAPPSVSGNIFSPLPFHPIFALCNEGNCRDDECTAQAAKYDRIE